MNRSSRTSRLDRPYPVARQRDVLRMKKRHWWVCIYGHEAHYSVVSMQTIFKPNPWVDYQRRWYLHDIKTFSTFEKAQASHSAQRLYAPFNNANAKVVLMRRTEHDIAWITEFKLYNTGEDL